MALEKFWNDVRDRNPLFREGLSPPDVPRVTAVELDADLTKRHAKWRPRGVLTGYDEKDFDFLESKEQSRLTEFVEEFNKIAPELKRALYGDARDEQELKELKDLTDPCPALPARHHPLVGARSLPGSGIASVREVGRTRVG